MRAEVVDRDGEMHLVRTSLGLLIARADDWDQGHRIGTVVEISCDSGEWRIVS